MGYSVIVLIASLTALATFSFAKLKVMQGDKFIIASLLCIILLIFFFIVYPTLAIFVSMFYDGDTFAPQQVMRILTQSYIVRVISNSLFLSGFVVIARTKLVTNAESKAGFNNGKTINHKVFHELPFKESDASSSDLSN